MVAKLEDIDKLENDHERIIILRKRLGKSQFEFANALGISSSYLGQIENYKFPFTDQLRERINNYLNKEQEMNGKDIFSDLK